MLSFRAYSKYFLCFFFLLGISRAVYPDTSSFPDQRVPKLDKPTSDTLIAIVFTQFGGTIMPEAWERRPGIAVVFALWQSGRIVWSRDMRWGGPPYCEAEIVSEKVETVLKAIDAKAAGLAIPAKSSWPSLVLEPSESFFLVRGYGVACAMETGFEIYEIPSKIPKVQLASGRVERLDGKTREEVLRSEPLEYQRFREFWSFAKKTLLDLIPKEGVRENESLRFPEMTVVDWKPLGKPDR